MIRLRDLSKSYRMGSTTVRALDGVTLEVEAGEALAILGHSGSGKSTLLQLVGGLDTPTSGEVEVNHRIISSLSEDDLAEYRRVSVGFVFQDFYLQPHLDTVENVELPLKLNRVPRRERRERANVALQQVGLADRGTHRPKELSGGERQRVCIARAIVHGPSILLADEPTGNLDSGTSGEIVDLFLSLWREKAVTVLIVTHNSDVARRIGKSVSLRDGRIIDGGADAPE
ncbi:MAG: ABC transporter ATP-binding protein [Planctomycetota bacterium]|nr:ABC transporter ATP-binding protein [Planctomycetota bacterium]